MAKLLWAARLLVGGDWWHICGPRPVQGYMYVRVSAGQCCVTYSDMRRCNNILCPASVIISVQKLGSSILCKGWALMKNTRRFPLRTWMPSG